MHTYIYIMNAFGNNLSSSKYIFEDICRSFVLNIYICNVKYIWNESFYTTKFHWELNRIFCHFFRCFFYPKTLLLSAQWGNPLWTPHEAPRYQVHTVFGGFCMDSSLSPMMPRDTSVRLITADIPAGLEVARLIFEG